VASEKYSVKPYEGPIHHTEGQWHNVIGPNGHRLNLSPMSPDEANHLARILNSASSAAADEVGRLREQIETLRNRDAVLDYIRDHCKVIAWPGAGAYPIEHNPIAGKDSWKDIALLAYAQARTATDASGAMKHKGNNNAQ